MPPVTGVIAGRRHARLAAIAADRLGELDGLVAGDSVGDADVEGEPCVAVVAAGDAHALTSSARTQATCPFLMVLPAATPQRRFGYAGGTSRNADAWRTSFCRQSELLVSPTRAK